VYLYGTELPDNCQAVDKLCDTGKHHVYFRSSGTLQDNASARRALEMQSQVLSAIAAGDYASAAKWTGAMTHYISDLASFGHVMGAGTDWGAEPESVHGNYEDHVQTLTDEPGEAVISVSFDGMLWPTSAYDAALALARDTTFDLSGMGHTAVWMNQTNDWNSAVFTARAYQSINLAVNYVAEAVHVVWSTAAVTTTTTHQQTTTTSSITGHVVINEFDQNPPTDQRSVFDEWAELFNPTGQAINVTGWKVSANHTGFVYTIPPVTTIGPGDYLIIQPGQLWLHDEWEIIVLKDSTGNVIDTTRNATDTQNNDRSWQRFPNGQDTDNDADWAPTLLPATKGVSNGGEVIVTTTTTQQQTTTTSQQLTTTTTSTTWSATTTTQQTTTSTTHVTTSTASTQHSPTTTSSVTTTRTTSTSTYPASTTSMTTSTTHQQTTTTITQQAGNFGMGFAFAVIGIGAGAAALGAGVAVAASGPLGSGVYACGGYYYCRKHKVPVWWVQGRLWCPADGRFVKP